ncbi:TIGR03619 family F420-dependent LLM class oxidoreductase [Actinopolymorpha pittospori]
MELGVLLPTSGPLASPEAITRVAQEAERIGYAAVWTYERLLRPIEKVELPGGGEPQYAPDVYRLTFEPLETLSYVAALTERIRLGTSILVAPLHVPVMLARRFATLDQFSRGRVIAGLGQGWQHHEFETANVSRSRRGARIEEIVAAMRAAWGPDPVEYEGDFYRIAPSEVNPKPVQAHLPVLMAGGAPPAIKRAGRIADGLILIAPSAADVRGMVETFHDSAREAGRDPDHLTVVAQAPVPITHKPIDADRPYLGGAPSQIAEDLANLRGGSVTQVYFAGMGLGADGLEDWVELLGEVHRAAAGAGALAGSTSSAA